VWSGSLKGEEWRIGEERGSVREATLCDVVAELACGDRD